jgi:hypothetical protein
MVLSLIGALLQCRCSYNGRKHLGWSMSGEYQLGPAMLKVPTNGGGGSWDPTARLCPVVALLAFSVNIL